MNELTYQQNFIQSVLSDEAMPDGRSLYQNNWIENAHRALCVSFPTVMALLGEENFRLISKTACQKVAKDCYDWGDWCLEEFPDIVRNVLDSQQLSSLDYVADCAVMDKSLFQCQRSSDPRTDIGSLSLLEQRDPDELALRLAASVRFIESAYPLDLLFAYVHERNMAATELTDAIDQARKSTEHLHFLVFRTDFKPQIVRLGPASARLYQLAANGKSVSELFAQATEFNTDFSKWLGEAIASKCVLATQEITN